jgi:hypothetical protein
MSQPLAWWAEQGNKSLEHKHGKQLSEPENNHRCRNRNSKTEEKEITEKRNEKKKVNETRDSNNLKTQE